MDTAAGKKRILIVDDEVSFARMVKLNLEKSGQFEVRAENKPTYALSAAREFKPDLIVVDVIMPSMGGRQLVGEIRQAAPHLRVLYTSGYTFDALGDVEEFESEREFLAKPYDQAQLGLKVHACLRRRAAAEGKVWNPASKI